ncbi:MAG TPA: hypothetical protein EYP19_09765 [Desulfobacterales bacterium]|nr:hypothetical protein [Desulfobacterales bacterium]
MTTEISSCKLADEIRRIYEADRLHAEVAIETYVAERLQAFSPDERLAFLERLLGKFDPGVPGRSGGTKLKEEVLSKLFSLLLGRDVYQADLSSTDLLERLAASLNTVFDTLNELVSVINTTLQGRSSGEETIRQVIGFHLEGQGESQSLEDYIGQIKKAFLTAQQAFKKAAHTTVTEMLHELDPEGIKTTGGGGLKFGPLRKAAFFEIYEERYHKCRKWLESGRCMEEFLREFEKNCQKLQGTSLTNRE